MLKKNYLRRWINTELDLNWDGEGYVVDVKSGYWYEGPILYLHATSSLDVDIYRWRDDDGSETAATWLEISDTTHDFDVSSGNIQARLRVDISESGGANASNQTYELQYSINGGAYSTVGAGTTSVRYFNSANLTDNTDTTEQLNGGGSFLGTGGQCEDSIVNSFVLSANSDLEAEFTLEFVAADLSDSDSINFRILAGGTSTVPATVTPNATITKGAAPTTFFKTLAVIQTGVVIQTRASEYFKILTITQIGISTLNKIHSYLKTLTIIQAGIPTFVKGLVSSLTLSATQIGIITFSKQAVAGITSIITQTGVITFSKVPTYVKTIITTQVGVPVFSRAATFFRSFSIIDGTITTMIKKIIKKPFIIIQIGIVTSAEALLSTISSVLTQSGIASFAKTFIAAGTVEEIRLYIRKLANMFYRVMKHTPFIRRRK